MFQIMARALLSCGEKMLKATRKMSHFDVKMQHFMGSFLLGGGLQGLEKIDMFEVVGGKMQIIHVVVTRKTTGGFVRRREVWKSWHDLSRLEQNSFIAFFDDFLARSPQKHEAPPSAHQGDVNTDPETQSRVPTTHQLD